MKPIRPKRFSELTPQERETFLTASSDFERWQVMGVTCVGFWLSKKPEPRPAWDTRPVPPHPKGLLWPGDCIDLTWDPAERAKVIAYVKQTRADARIRYMGYSWCRLCKETAPPRDPHDVNIAPWESNGTADYGDGVFIWPEGYAHYIEVHGVKPPQDFIDHILAGGSLK